MLIGEQSCIKVDHHMKTTIDGLYAIGDCSYCGSGLAGAVPAPPGRNRGSGILNAVFAALCCAEEVGTADLSCDAAPACEKQTQATIDHIAEYLCKAEGCRPEDVFRMASTVPAQYLGIAGLGHIRPGARACLAAWTEDFRPAFSLVDGVPSQM